MQQNKPVRRSRLVLYYQGYCTKCKILSKIVVVMSLNFIKRIPLEREDSIKLFFEDHPKAKGYPILFIGDKPVYNYWVFPAVPIAIVLSWVYRIKSVFTTDNGMIHKRESGNPPFLSD